MQSSTEDKRETQLAIDEKDERENAPKTTTRNNKIAKKQKQQQQKRNEYFLGFKDQSSKLKELWHRWKALEDWIELAVRPRNCHPDDRWLLSTGKSSRGADNDSNDDDDDGDDIIDDLVALKKQCLLVQTLFNDHISTLSIETTVWESSLAIQHSQIPGAGMGLFYQPLHHHHQQQQQQQQHRSENSDTTGGMDLYQHLPSGSTICYYTGYVHTYSSASATLSDRSYLMWIRGNTLVDPRPLPHIKARYANDPLNDDLVNCAFVPATMHLSRNDDVNASPKSSSPPNPHCDTIRTSVVTIRDILPGEEIFVQYGDAYWNQQPIVGNRLVLKSSNNSNKCNNECNNKCNNGMNESANTSQNDGDGDSDDGDDLDETFPFSPLFQSKLTKKIIWDNASISTME